MNEENKTINIVKYIFIFFGIVSLIGIGYFSYITYFKETKIEIPVDELKDDSFNNLFKDLEKDRLDEERTTNNENYVENNCYIGDLVIKSGDKVKLYSRKIVNPYENCEDFARERVCDDGFILGDESFKFPSCKVDLDCQLPDDSILKNNESIKLYSRKTVPFGETCERYALVRKCKNNQLTGDDRFVYKKCKISYDNSCDVGGGHVLADNQTHVFYKKREVEYGQKCIDFSKRLICSDSIIQGGDITEYKYWDCEEKTPKDCYIDGIKIEHGESRDLYSKKFGTEYRTCDFYRENRTCTNGVLDGQSEYHYANCYNN
jgi:hypothetical protein